MTRTVTPVFDDSENVEADFRFKTFGEMVAAFGRPRAASLLVKARAQRGVNAKVPTLTLEDVELTRLFLGFTPAGTGQKYGPQSGKALKVFKAFANSETSARGAVKRFLDKTERDLRQAG